MNNQIEVLLYARYLVKLLGYIKSPYFIRARDVRALEKGGRRTALYFDDLPGVSLLARRPEWARTSLLDLFPAVRCLSLVR